MSAFLEVSTMGLCVVGCKYCPQETLRNNYCGSMMMELDTFKKAIDMLPNESTISFAGFSEPCTNPYIVDMILYAAEKQHKIMLLTTLVGLTIEKYKLIKDLCYAHFSIHLPDNEGKTPINITYNYKNLLTYIINNPPKGNFIFNHHEGDIHPDIKNIVSESRLIDIHDRAGNIELEKDYTSVCHTGEIKCGHAFMFNYDDGGAVLIPNGDCVLCCSDFGLENILGNIYDDDWNDIVNSTIMKRIENGLLDDSQDIICRKCYLAKKV